MTSIIKDDRKIVKLVYEDGEAFSVGKSITKIVAYEENGQMEAVPWFEIWEGDFLSGRVNAATISVVYYEEE